MSTNVVATLGYGSSAEIADRLINDVNFDGEEFYETVSELNLEYVEVSFFGNYRYQSLAEMGWAVFVKSSMQTFNDVAVELLTAHSVPEITDEILAELDAVREYFDFTDVLEFGWLLGRSLA